MSVAPAWGLGYVVPEDAIAAWGARLIVTQAGDVDILWDRQGDDAGPHSDELVNRLNDGLIKHMRETLRELLLGSIFEGEYVVMSTREDGDFILYMDDRVVMHANTRGSCGYCYVTAWLYPDPGLEEDLRIIRKFNDDDGFVSEADKRGEDWRDD